MLASGSFSCQKAEICYTIRARKRSSQEGEYVDIQNLRWWGWGTLDQAFDLEGRTAFWPGLERMLELPGDRELRPPVTLEEINLRPTRLDDRRLASLRKLLGHQNLDTTQQYARIYDETLYEQSKTSMSRLEAIAVDDWPGVNISAPVLAENRTVGPA